MSTRTFRLRTPALFHAAQSSSWCGVASVLPSSCGGWTVVKGFHHDASAIFVNDYLVWSERTDDRPVNYFGYVCLTVGDVKQELDAANAQ